jgi:hypothetical protein
MWTGKEEQESIGSPREREESGGKEHDLVWDVGAGVEKPTGKAVWYQANKIHRRVSKQEKSATV